MSPIADRLAAAPISWGVSEVPGWGYQAQPDEVLGAMSRLGFTATEFGPEGFLPRDPGRRRESLAAAGMQAIGGFYPAVLHDPDADLRGPLEAELAAYRAAGAGTLVLAASSGTDGYDTRPVLDDAQWQLLTSTVRMIDHTAREHGIRVVLHPHVGTVVETAEEVDRVVEATEVAVCLDTGHLHAAGADVLDFTRRHRDRIVHTHLKDVDDAVATAVREERMSFTEGVQDRGLFVPVGHGDLPFEAIIQELLDAGYEGWFTFEQDRRLTGPEDVAAATEDARLSAEFLRELGTRLAA